MERRFDEDGARHAYRLEEARSIACEAREPGVGRETMAEVLFVSKPIAPPWNDGSKNLARDIATHLQRHVPVVMGRRGQASPIRQARLEEVYGSSSEDGFAPGLRESSKVFRRLLLGPRADVWHFFFAPNPKSSTAARLARALRRVPSVHTVCSMPPQEARVRKLLFADVTVALSRASHRRLRQEGVPQSELRLIPPCVPALPLPTLAERTSVGKDFELPERAPVWIYPGDLEHGGGAEIALQGLAASNRRDAVLLMACRPKTPRAAEARERLEAQAKRWGIDTRVRWVGETPRIHALLAASDFVVMVNRDHFAKMDYPLVALEAMALGRTVLVGSQTPCAELAEQGGAWAVSADGEALAEAVERLSAEVERRRSLERQARALAATRFCPAAVAAAYERLYEEIRARPR